MWYYQENYEAKGPVTQSEIEELIKNRKVSKFTLVWKEGMSDWEAAVNTDLSNLLSRTPPPISPPPIEKPAAEEKTATKPVIKLTAFQKETLSKVKSLRAQSMRLIVSSIIMLILPLGYLDQRMPLEFYQSLQFAIGISAIISFVFFLQFLYAAWSLLPNTITNDKPSRVIIAMLIPSVNIVAIYPAFYGLAKHLIDYMRAYGVSTASNQARGFSLAACICTTISFVLLVPIGGDRTTSAFFAGMFTCLLAIVFIMYSTVLISKGFREVIEANLRIDSTVEVTNLLPNKYI